VVSKIFFHPYLGKIPSLTNYSIFQRGWNHQLDKLNRSLSPWRCWHWHVFSCAGRLAWLDVLLHRDHHHLGHDGGSVMLHCVPLYLSNSIGSQTSTRMAVMFTLWDPAPHLHNSWLYCSGFGHRMTLIRDIRGTSFTFNQWLCWCFMLDEICQKKWMGRVSSLDIQKNLVRRCFTVLRIYFGGPNFQIPGVWMFEGLGICQTNRLNLPACIGTGN